MGKDQDFRYILTRGFHTLYFFVYVLFSLQVEVLLVPENSYLILLKPLKDLSFIYQILNIFAKDL
jgi:hypothetical protein